MGKRLGVIGVIVENIEAADEINRIFHEYSALIVGRMGIPYRERKVSVISVIVDGEENQINALTGRLGRVPLVSVKVMLAKQ